MKHAKGCTNESCSMSQKKRAFKEAVNLCPECGTELVAVCKKCYTVLSDPGEVYCVGCKAKRDDRNDKIKERVLAAAGTVALAGGFVLKKRETIAKVVTKIIPK